MYIIPSFKVSIAVLNGVMDYPALTIEVAYRAIL